MEIATEKKWVVIDAGKIQIGRVTTAARRLRSLKDTYRELYGTKGGEEGSSMITAFILGGDTEPRNPEALRLYRMVGDQFGWEITKKNAAAIIKTLEGMIPLAEIACPTEDNRKTPEVEAKEQTMRDVQRVEFEAKQAETEKQADKVRELAPAGWKAVIYAELHENDSDTMSDYHNHKTIKKVLLGFRKSTRENFASLRKASALFPETEHLGPGCEVHIIRAVITQDESETGRYVGRYSYGDIDGDRYSTEAEAQAAIEAAEDIGPRSKYVIETQKIEHRENYSMGAGNYLKDGYRDSSGWAVFSCDIEGGWIREFDTDHFEALQAAPAPTVSRTPAALAYIAGAEVLEVFHTKRKVDVYLVVPADRLSRDEFETKRDEAKALGGWYSRKWGKTPGGFMFKDRPTADQFAATFGPGDTPPRGSDEPSGESEASKSGATGKSAPIVDRFRKMAVKLDAEISAKRAPRRESTHRQQGQVMSARAQADHLERTACALRALADLHETGKTYTAILGFRTKKEIHEALAQIWTVTGYNHGHESGEYYKTDISSAALQKLVNKAKDPAQAEADRVRMLESEVKNCNIPGFFPTPADLIDEMLQLAKIDSGHVVLEPSAGIGTIADAIKEKHGITPMLFEVNHKLREILAAKGYAVVGDDCLECTVSGGADRIVMNPPFEKGQDFAHVQHCYDLLAPGGRLVALMANGGTWRNKAEPWLNELAAYWVTLVGAFSGIGAFNQTGVNVNLVVIDKPAQQ